MHESLPTTFQTVINWDWSQFEPYYRELEGRELSAAAVSDWLADWSRVGRLLAELYDRLYVATTIDTTDEDAVRRYHNYMEHIYPQVTQADHALNQKLLASGLQPDGFAIPLRNIRTRTELFREANLLLLTEESKLSTAHDKIIGAQTVEWEGKEITLAQVFPIYHDTNRAVRERAWRLASQRQLADRDALNKLWVKFLDLRGRMAVNAGFSDYRAFRWRDLLRFDYTPEDCEAFHRAIEQVVVPAASRLYEKRRQRLGVDTLRPWDLWVDTKGRPVLRPFATTTDLETKVKTIFDRVDPQLGKYVQIMRNERLLDLDNRKGKAPGGYCTAFATVKRPFIFMNAVGLHQDVQTLLHESGHSFHVFESAHLPYQQQQEVPMEFAEVASMAMELLGAPYLPADQGGFYSEQDAARARIEHLEGLVTFWPYMALVDAFQHWVYTHQTEANDPADCDAKWAELWARFMKGVDWSGLDDEMATGWQRKLHIFQVPFYYVEYGLAQLGAVQVWANSLEDQAAAVASYRRALSLGGTVTLPELFAAAGAKFAFDPATMSRAVTLIESTISRLESA